MKYVYYAALLCLAAFTVDLAVTHAQEWHKRRKRAREMARFNIGAFKGTKANSWWEA